MKVSIGIKALNEEKHIAKALESAVTAAQALGGEVILADSGSSDRTIEIARGYPIEIVQLKNRDERCCGAGAQLAFQHARGEFFYLLDGDMTLDPEFLPAGIAFLEAHPEVAGVGGRVREINTTAHEFQIRANTVDNNANWLAGEVDRLDCGGLYRTSAIREVGYFADRNLHAFEEFELAARLRGAGYKLMRLDLPAVQHYGHAMNGYALLLRRIRSGYSGAPGEVLRGALGRSHLGLVVKGLGHVRHAMVVIAWWCALLLALLWPAGLLTKLSWLAVLLLAPLAWLTYRRGSLTLGLYSMTAWNVSAAGLISGLFRSRTPPTEPLASVQLQSQQRP